MTVGGGYSEQKQKQSSETNPFVKFSQPYFENQLLPLTQQVTNQYDPTGGQGMRDANQYYADTLSGKYLYGNPALDNALGATENEYMKMATQGVNQAAGNAARSGMLPSTAAMTMESNAAKNAADQYAQIAANARLANYGQERGYQNQAAQMPRQQQQLMLQQLMELMSPFRAGGTSSSSGVNRGFSVSGSASAGSK